MKKHLLYLLLLPLFVACSKPASPPNFIIFIADDVSWDDLGAYGNTRVKTPAIDGLASAGLIFNNTYLTASSCSPSRNSILLGRYPHNTGAAELHSKPPVHMLSLPQVLREAGYHTVHSGKYHQGDYSEVAFSEIHREREKITSSGEGMWLENIRSRPLDKPFFMWFAALDAHRDWGENDFSGTHHPDEMLPPEYLVDAPATRKDLAQYYDEIYRFDRHIAMVTAELERQGVLEETMIIVMADNGRPFPHSKTRVNDRGMKTPFIIHWPDRVKAAQECDALVSVIDIAPTLLDLAGLEPPASFQGRSFAGLLERPGQDFRNYVFAEHNWHDYEAHERMVRDKRYMYIRNSRPGFPQAGPADAVGSPSYADLDSLRRSGTITAFQSDVFSAPRSPEELYFYPDDPMQKNNLAAADREVPGEPKTAADREALEHLRSILDRWMEETADNVPEHLTPAWFEYAPGYVKTPEHGQRGEMPGSSLNATAVNASGPF